MIFGEPLYPVDGEDARRFGARVEAAVAVLADEVRTDWWSARRRAADGSTPSPQGPDTAPWRRAWSLDPAPYRPHRATEGDRPHRPAVPRRPAPALATPGLNVPVRPPPAPGGHPAAAVAYRTWAAWNRTSGTRTRTST